MPAAPGSRNVIIHDEEWELLGRLAKRLDRPRSWVLTRLVRSANRILEKPPLKEESDGSGGTVSGPMTAPETLDFLDLR